MSNQATCRMGLAFCDDTPEEDGDFEFRGNPILQSTAGIFTMCFCRGNCSSSLDFKASVGFFTARGPFPTKTVCLQGQTCSWQLLGIGLSVGDRLVFRGHSCQAWNDEELGVSNVFQTFMNISEPVEVQEDGNGLEVDLGTLAFGANPGPGAYQVCWCPAGMDCTSPWEFRASAGELQVDCPPGTMNCLYCGFLCLKIHFDPKKCSVFFLQFFVLVSAPRQKTCSR